jgi:hypothetical protein
MAVEDKMRLELEWLLRLPGAQIRQIPQARRAVVRHGAGQCDCGGGIEI